MNRNKMCSEVFNLVQAQPLDILDKKNVSVVEGYCCRFSVFWCSIKIVLVL